MSTIPGFNQIQFEGFCRFIDQGLAEERSKFPKIEDTNQEIDFELFFERYQLVEPLIKDAMYESLTYSSELYVSARLIWINDRRRYIQEQTILIGKIPLMTSLGAFIVNGIYRIVINQILQSPGIYYRSELNDNGISVYTGTIISDWGGRLELEIDRKARIWVRVSRQQKVSILVLLSAMGLNIKEILENVCYPELFLSFVNEKKRSKENANLEFYQEFTCVEGDPVFSKSLSKDLQKKIKIFQQRCELGGIGRRNMNRRLNLDISQNNTFFRADRLIRIKFGMDTLDDMNHMQNKRIHSVADLLQEQFGLALVPLENMARGNIYAALKHNWTPTPQNLLFGPGGLTARNATFPLRDIHPSHYGPIHARIGRWGSLESLFSQISERSKGAQMLYLAPGRDEYYMVAAGNSLALNQGIQEEQVVPARYRQEFLTIAWEQVHLQTSLIPFIEHNDANRALMSSNMQRQAVPLSQSEKCIVGTGLEGQAALDSGALAIAEHEGKIFYTDTDKILLSGNGDTLRIPLVMHQLDDKIHGHSSGRYSHLTQQPLKGRAKKGGQRVGEMEVWALEGFGVAYILQEVLTYKSDHIRARQEVLGTITFGGRIPTPEDAPESFRLFVRELRSFALELNHFLEGSLIEMKQKLSSMIDQYTHQQLRIGLVSPQQISTWSKKILPNGEIVGENFWAYQKWNLCLWKLSKMKRKTRNFVKCGVEFVDSRIRKYQMGYIKLAYPVMHVWYLKRLPSYIVNPLDKPLNELEDLVYCGHRGLTVEVNSGPKRSNGTVYTQPYERKLSHPILRGGGSYPNFCFARPIDKKTPLFFYDYGNGKNWRKRNPQGMNGKIKRAVSDCHGPFTFITSMWIASRNCNRTFQAFVIRDLIRKHIASNNGEILDDHPLLLNRAPTLHRLGIQAFLPVLVEGRAICLHPLAQAEARLRMFSHMNLLSPIIGDPISAPTQDMLSGLYVLTSGNRRGIIHVIVETIKMKIITISIQKKKNPFFCNTYDAIGAYRKKQINLVSPLWLRWRLDQRVIAAREAPIEINYESLGTYYDIYGHYLIVRSIKKEILYIYIRTNLGHISLYREIEEAIQRFWQGCYNSMLPAGIRVSSAQRSMEVLMVERLTQVFHNKVIDKTAMKRLISRFIDHYGIGYTSHILDQVKTLGFRQATATSISLGIDDLLTIPFKRWLIQDVEQQSFILEKNHHYGNVHTVEKLRQSIEIWYAISEYLRQETTPNFRMTDPFNPVHIMSFSGARGNASQDKYLHIQRNLREGLSLTEYIISCYGARKGVVDTAIRTSDVGYLTRRLVEAVQHIFVRRTDCGTVRAQPISIRTPFTCRSTSWICQLCYGRSPTHDDLVELGEALGIIAGEPWRSSLGPCSIHKDQDQMNAYSLSVKRRSISNPSVTNNQTRELNSIVTEEDFIEYRGVKVFWPKYQKEVNPFFIPVEVHILAESSSIMVLHNSIIGVDTQITLNRRSRVGGLVRVKKKAEKMKLIIFYGDIHFPGKTNKAFRLIPPGGGKQNSKEYKKLKNWLYIQRMKLSRLFPTDLLQESDNLQLRVVNYILYYDLILEIWDTSIQLVRTCLVLNWDQDKKIEKASASLIDLAMSPISYTVKRKDLTGSGLISENGLDRAYVNPFSSIYSYSKARIQESLNTNQGTIHTLLNRNKESQSLIILSSSNCYRIGPFNDVKSPNVIKESIKKDPLIPIRNSLGPLGTGFPIYNFDFFSHLITHNKILIFQILKYYLPDENGKIYNPYSCSNIILNPFKLNWYFLHYNYCERHLQSLVLASFFVKIQKRTAFKIRSIDSVVIRSPKPDLATPGATVHGHYGEILYEGDILVTFIYEKSRSGDITQGLPKVEQVQKVYRSQGVQIHNRHIEIIVRQITSKVLKMKCLMFFRWRTNCIVASGTNGARFGRSDLLPSRLIGNNKSIHEYSKFHIRSEFSRNRSSFNKSSSPGAYRLVERPERKRCSGGWYLLVADSKHLQANLQHS
ncbi:LOW QUALITY PROTEIN: hypothetical protein M8C21_033124 [Ambrosia artemisiifolia]|uniref:DNA-directed RNA polymerase n=1 Tax=Ambrosia artemisiifolia TaxID=4212 RepID=A0AAD5GSX8_AMBAR|nr:LOW QUALITY PROTEIN: hypothetical protein M8C21_033124 [Ambrosia artemisiifolia]